MPSTSPLVQNYFEAIDHKHARFSLSDQVVMEFLNSIDRIQYAWGSSNPPVARPGISKPLENKKVWSKHVRYFLHLTQVPLSSMKFNQNFVPLGIVKWIHPIQNL